MKINIAVIDLVAMMIAEIGFCGLGVTFVLSTIYGMEIPALVETVLTIVFMIGWNILAIRAANGKMSLLEYDK